MVFLYLIRRFKNRNIFQIEIFGVELIFEGNHFYMIS